MYSILAAQILLLVATRDLIPEPLGIAGYWLGGATLILLIRRAERRVHPAEVGCWTWQTLLL